MKKNLSLILIGISLFAFTACKASLNQAQEDVQKSVDNVKNEYEEVKESVEKTKESIDMAKDFVDDKMEKAEKVNEIINE